MPIDLKKLKEVGKDIQVTKPHSSIQPKVLAIVRNATKSNEGLTQRDVADILAKKLGRDVRPQQARSCLHSLIKKGTVVRRVISPPDESGNAVFYYAKV